MPYLILPSRRLQRPVGQQRLNYSHYRTHGLSLAWLGNSKSGGPTPGNRPIALTPFGSPQLVTSPYGIITSFNGSTEYFSIFSPPLIASSSTPLTITWAELPGTVATYNGVFAIPVGGSNSLIGIRATTAGSPYDPLTISRAGTGVRFNSASTIAEGINITAGVFRRLVLVGTAGVGSITAADWTLYVDGKAYPATGTTATGTTTNAYIGWDALDSKFPGGLFDVNVVERAWGPDEVAEYYEDPYGHWMPISTRLYFGVSGAAAGAFIPIVGYGPGPGLQLAGGRGLAGE